MVVTPTQISSSVKWMKGLGCGLNDGHDDNHGDDHDDVHDEEADHGEHDQDRGHS